MVPVFRRYPLPNGAVIVSLRRDVFDRGVAAANQELRRMTWGSNPTGQTVSCRYCGADQVDDGNPPTHEKTCRYRHWWMRIIRLIAKR